MKNQMFYPGYWIAWSILAMCGTFQLVAHAQSPLPWEKLGTRTVDYSIDRDVVTPKINQSYSALKIKVKGGLINIHKLTIQFANGEVLDIDMPDEMNKDNDGRLIDLKGNNRAFRQIIFWYDTKNSDKHKAIVEVWARK